MTCVWWRSSALHYRSLWSSFECCCHLFCSAVPGFRLFLFWPSPTFISSSTGSFLTAQLWEGENNLGGMADTSFAHNSYHCCVVVPTPAFDIVPLGAGGDLLTRVTVPLLCRLETIVCVRGMVVLNRSCSRAFSFHAVPLYGLSFESVFSINNSADIIHSLVIFARGVWLSVWAEKLV